MKKVLLFDAFSFVGFVLCRKMLEEEINVLAVDDTPKENSSSEEKMLSIGRNAFFEFVEYPKAMNQRMFEDVDAVVYQWFDPNRSERKGEKEERLQTILDFCNETKTKLILASACWQKVDSNEDLDSELDDRWFSKINFKNSFSEHRKIQTKNIECLFTFIDFSNHSLDNAIQKKNDHEEWIFQNFSNK